MKEMVYKRTKTVEVLASGIYRDYEYMIVSYGSHPCAYVKLEKNNVYYGLSDTDMPYLCHGGVTYSAPTFKLSSDTENWWIGWDYCHCDDYFEYSSDYYAKFNAFYDATRKKWTTEEIYKEVTEVIDNIIEDNIVSERNE